MGDKLGWNLVGDWRLKLRTELFENAPPEALAPRSLTGISRFVEAVAEEMGPMLRAGGMEELDVPAEYVAGHRCMDLVSRAHLFAARMGEVFDEASKAGMKPQFGEDVQLQELAGELRGEYVFLRSMMEHSALLDDDLTARALRGAWAAASASAQ